MTARQRTQSAPADTRRAEALKDLTAAVGQLADAMETCETVDWWPTREHPGWAHKPGCAAGGGCSCRPLPRRAEKRVVRTYAPGLLEQLRVGAGRRRAVAKPEHGTVDASGLVLEAGPAAGARYDQGGGRAAPGWRAPGSLVPVETWDELARKIAAARAEARAAAGYEDTRPLPVAAALRDLVGVALELDTRHLVRVAARARGWAFLAAVALRYEAPLFTLREYVCHRCGGALRVPLDGAADMRCVGTLGRSLVEGPAAEGRAWPLRNWGCGMEYPRVSWGLLLREDGCA